MEHRLELKPQVLPPSPTRNREYEQRIEQLERELRVKESKLSKKKDKVQTIIQPVPQQVIIEKPVERIVEIEKIVPVERIIRERIPNRQPIVVTQPQAVENNDEEIEEYIEQISILKKKISEITAEL